MGETVAEYVRCELADPKLADLFAVVRERGVWIALARNPDEPVARETALVHTDAIIDDGNGCTVSSEIRRQNHMNIRCAGVKSIGDKLFNRLMGT